jgi:hypothetical protein
MAHDNPTAEALELWQEIIGMTPQSRAMTIGTFHHMSEFEHLREALELDPSEITANLMLGAYARAHFRQTVVSQAELLENVKGVLDKLEKPRRLMALLERPEIVERRDMFLAGVAAALEQYGAAERDDVKALLADHDGMAFLRRDALRSMANLSVHQFLDGDPEPEGVKPVYYRFVQQFFNLNSLLSHAARQAPGVSLNLVRDPNDYQSYFCFAIRNGGRLFVLSDVPENPHPMAPMLSRRPDKDMDRRIARNWFPYGLMGVAYNAESGKLYIDRSSERSLVVEQTEALPLLPISKLGPEEVVWTSMMFGLIVDRFWRKGFVKDALSYTAEMIRVQDRMLAAAVRSGLPVKGYTKIDMAELRLSDVMKEDISSSVGSRDDHQNRWIEERYGHLVSEGSLNVIASPERRHTLNLASGEIASDASRKSLSAEFSGHSKAVAQVAVEKLPSTHFGTKEQLEKDRMFLARYNFAVQIDALARNEYERRKDEITKWYRERVAANLDAVKSWVRDGVTWIEDDHEAGHHAGYRYHPKVTVDGVMREVNLRSIFQPWEWENTYVRQHLIGSHYIGGFKEGRPLCAVNGTKATYVYTVNPGTPEELAMVAGCGLADLPDVLRHFTLKQPHGRNYILQRVDPVEWVVNNPWSDGDYRVSLLLSKRAFAALDKTHSVPDYVRRRAFAHPVSYEWRRPAAAD